MTLLEAARSKKQFRRTSWPKKWGWITLDDAQIVYVWGDMPLTRETRKPKQWTILPHDVLATDYEVRA